MEGNYQDLTIRDFEDVSKLFLASRSNHSNQQPKFTNLDIFEALCRQELVTKHHGERIFKQKSVTLCSKSLEAICDTKLTKKRRHNVADVEMHENSNGKHCLFHEGENDVVLGIMEQFYKELFEKYYGLPESGRKNMDFKRLLRCQEKYFKMIETRGEAINTTSDLSLQPQQLDPSNAFQLCAQGAELNYEHPELLCCAQVNSSKIVNSRKNVNLTSNLTSKNNQMGVCDSILEIGNLLFHVGKEHKKIQEDLLEAHQKNSDLLNCIKELENNHDTTLIELSSLKSELIELVGLYGAEGNTLFDQLNNGVSKIIHDGFGWRNRYEYLEFLLTQDDIGEQLLHAMELISEKDKQTVKLTNELEKLRNEYGRIAEELKIFKEAEEINLKCSNHIFPEHEPISEIPQAKGRKFGCILRIKSSKLLTIIRNFIHRLLYWNCLRKYEQRNGSIK